MVAGDKTGETSEAKGEKGSSFRLATSETYLRDLGDLGVVREAFGLATHSFMACKTRCIQAGLAYHVTQRGSNKQAVFFDPSDYQIYLRLLRNNYKESGVKILAYCLMPNHVHLIVRPEFDDSLGVFFRRVHGQYSRYINLKEGRTGHLWQNHYFSCVLSETHLIRALRYVEHNPVRASLAERPETFQWSSAAAHLGAMDVAQVLDFEFWEAQGGAYAWRTLLATPEEQLEERRLRASTFTGRPYGDDLFIQAQEESNKKVNSAAA